MNRRSLRFSVWIGCAILLQVIGNSFGHAVVVSDERYEIIPMVTNEMTTEMDGKSYREMELELTINPLQPLLISHPGFTLQLGAQLANGQIIFPPDGETFFGLDDLISVNPDTRAKVYRSSIRYPLEQAIPSEVDLTTFLTVQDFEKAAVFRGSLGTPFQKAADGILNENRPSIGVSISSPSLLFADGTATADMEVQMNNTSLDISRDRIVISGSGVLDFEPSARIDSEQFEQLWTQSFTAFRSSEEQVSLEIFTEIWTIRGTRFLIPLVVTTEGDWLEDNEAPGLSEVRWTTYGQDSTFLDIYPLWGRDAFSDVFVQLDLTDDVGLDPSSIIVFVDTTLFRDGIDYPVDLAEILFGKDLSEGTYQAVLRIYNDFKWSNFTEGITLPLKVVVLDLFGNETVLDLGNVGLFGPDPGDAPVDEAPPDAPVDIVINNGNTVVPSGFGNSITVPFSFSTSDTGTGVLSAELTYQSPIFKDKITFTGTPLNRISGSANSGSYEGSTFVDKFVESGTYNLISAIMEDAFGNTVNYSKDELDESNLTSFELSSNLSDLTKPVLAGAVTTTVSVADVSSEFVIIEATNPVMDVGTGISFGTFGLFHPTDPNVEPLSITFSGEQLGSGTLKDGVLR